MSPHLPEGKPSRKSFGRRGGLQQHDDHLQERAPLRANSRGDQARPSKRTALPLRMPGMTSGLKPATSKSFIQRSGVMSG